MRRTNATQKTLNKIRVIICVLFLFFLDKVDILLSSCPSQFNLFFTFHSIFLKLKMINFLYVFFLVLNSKSAFELNIARQKKTIKLL